MRCDHEVPAGTCGWKPFVEQTVEMLRDHDHNYSLGPGYQVHDDGRVTEQYWCPVHPSQAGSVHVGEDADGVAKLRQKLPYKVELVGVTCSPTLAVARGFWRRLRTGRGVPVAAQLRSHKAFAGALLMNTHRPRAEQNKQRLAVWASVSFFVLVSPGILQ